MSIPISHAFPSPGITEIILGQGQISRCRVSSSSGLGLGYFGMAVPDLLSILWLKLRSTEFWVTKYLFFGMFRDVFEDILALKHMKKIWCGLF